VSTLQVLAPNIGELATDLGSAYHYRDCLFPGVKSLMSVLSVPPLGKSRMLESLPEMAPATNMDTVKVFASSLNTQ
jgi:hypothetical protein